MIQITKKNAQLLFNQNERKTKFQDLLINLLVLFQRKFSEDKVKSESFDRFVKTNQQK